MKARFSRTRHSAFTLVELLVVITIIAILISSLLPAIKKAKEHARRIHCMSGVRQIVAACVEYSVDFKGFFPPGEWGTPTSIGGGGAAILLYMQDTPSAFGATYATLPNATAPTKIMACPSWEGFGADSIGYYPIGVGGGSYHQGPGTNLIHFTYIYVGGEGRPDDSGPPWRVFHGDLGAAQSGWWWHGWPCGQGSGGAQNFANYDDPGQIGPVWNMESRGRTATTALVTDRMWLPGQSEVADPYNWDDVVGTIRLNHPKGIEGNVDGGSVGMVDGHVEWRNSDIIQERVRAYSGYRPYVCY